ncbi:MAG: AAA family ATPase, partial [Actinomycetota bacterium]|nr:AAA family ATPase [Actinomycetota bacterium]
VGEAGVGKSRLCHEFVERAGSRGIAVYQASGTSHGRTIPFLAALEMLRGYFGVADQDDDQLARERIAGRLLLLHPAFADDLPLVFDFMGVPDPQQPAPNLNPEGRQRRLLDVVRRLVHARSRREPAINLLEDLHWVDAGSAAFLEALIDAVPGSRSLVVLNFRPEYRAEWMSRSYYHQLPLVPLGAEAADELLRDLIGTDPSLNGLFEEIRRRTGGNPFFIEEVVRALLEDGSLGGEPGAYRLVRTIESVAVPPTVQAVLAARIDRLEERDKGILQVAAVLGREFSESILERITQLSPPELAGALRALVGGEFLDQRDLYPEPGYAFKHPLTHEVAYRSQLSDRRQRVHAAVAKAIAELYPDSLDERAALLAHHWEAAGEQIEAARWHARAAAWVGTNDPAVAVRHWRKVRELVAELPEGPETAGLGITARTFILSAGWRLGISEQEAESLFAEGKELAQRVGDRASLAVLTATYAGTMGLAGGMSKALELMTEADRALEELGIPAARVAVLQFRAYALFVCGRSPEALPLVDLALDLTEADPTLGAGVVVGSPHAFFQFIKAITVATLGELEEAHRLAQRAIEVAREQRDFETEGWGYMAHAQAAYFAGDTEQLLPAAARSVEIAERIGDSFSRSWAQHYLGLAHVVRGEWDEAKEVLERSIALSRETRTGLEGEPWKLAFLVEAHLGRGDIERAVSAGERGVAVARDLELTTSAPVAHMALARALLASNAATAVTDAERELAHALEVARAIKARPIEARVHSARAELERARGDQEAEERELRAARALFKEIGASPLVDTIDRELATVTATGARAGASL